MSSSEDHKSSSSSSDDELLAIPNDPNCIVCGKEIPKAFANAWIISRNLIHEDCIPYKLQLQLAHYLAEWTCKKYPDPKKTKRIKFISCFLE